MCCFIICLSFSFLLIIASTLFLHWVMVSLLLSRPSLTKWRFSHLPHCHRSFLLSCTSSLLQKVVASSCRASHFLSDFCSLSVRCSLSLLNSDTSDHSFSTSSMIFWVRNSWSFCPFFFLNIFQLLPDTVTNLHAASLFCITGCVTCVQVCATCVS